VSSKHTKLHTAAASNSKDHMHIDIIPLQMLESYLENCFDFVGVEDCLSNKENVAFGVHQGQISAHYCF